MSARRKMPSAITFRGTPDYRLCILAGAKQLHDLVCFHLFKAQLSEAPRRNNMFQVLGSKYDFKILLPSQSRWGMALTQREQTSPSSLSGEFIAAEARGSCVLVNRMLSQYNNGRTLNRLFSLGQFYFLSSNTDPSDKFTLKMAFGSRLYSENKCLGPSW